MGNKAFPFSSKNRRNVSRGTRGRGICFSPGSGDPLAPLPLCERDFMRKHLCQREGERLERGVLPAGGAPSPSPLTGRLCSDTEMLLGCTATLRHWVMLPAKRNGSSARSQRSRGEHLPHRSAQSTENTPQGTEHSPNPRGGVPRQGLVMSHTECRCWAQRVLENIL